MVPPPDAYRTISHKSFTGHRHAWKRACRMKMEPSEVVRWQLRRGVGKANHELAKITGSKLKAKRPHFVFAISREEIERGLFSRMRSQFSLDSPTEELRSTLGRVTFVLADYENTEENLFEIQSVRDYFAELNRHWPVWLAFCELDSDILRMLAACIVRDLSAVAREDEEFYEIHVRRGELNRLFMNAVPLTSAFHQLAGFSSVQRRKRLDAVARYLDLT